MYALCEDGTLWRCYGEVWTAIPSPGIIKEMHETSLREEVLQRRISNIINALPKGWLENLYDNIRHSVEKGKDEYVWDFGVKHTEEAIRIIYNYIIAETGFSCYNQYIKKEEITQYRIELD